MALAVRSSSPIVLACVAGLALAAASANAQNISWAASNPGSWNSSGSWSPANIPDSVSENAIIPFGAAFFISISSASLLRIGALDMPLAGPTINLLSNSSLTLTAPSRIEGTVLVNVNPPSAASTLSIESFSGIPLPITGAGTIALSGSTANLTQATLAGTGNAGSLFGPNVLIRGLGRLTGIHRIQGVLRSDVPGGGIDIDGATVGGDGLGRIEATQADVYVSDNAVVTNAAFSTSGPNRIRLNGLTNSTSTATLQNCSLSGNSFLETGTLYFYNSAVSGYFLVANSTSMRIRGPQLPLNGTIDLLNNTNCCSNYGMVFEDICTISGSGEIVMRQTTSDYSVFSATNNLPVTITSGITVRGKGRVTGDFNLGGTFFADDSARATLELRTCTINGTGTGMLKVGDGTMLLTEVDLNGVDVDATGSGEFRVGGSNSSISAVMNNVLIDGPTIFSAGTANLTGVEFDGKVGIRAGARVEISGFPFVLNGDLTINETYANSTTSLIFEQNGSVSGTGRFILRGNPQNINTGLLGTLSTTVVALPAACSIDGAGTINGRFQLAGPIRANDPNGVEMGIRGSALTNSGGASIQSLSAPLAILDSTVTGMPITSSGDVIRIGTGSGANFTFAPALNQLTLTGPARFEAGTTILNDVILNGLIEIRAGAVARVTSNALTLNGTLTINPLSAAGTTSLSFDQTAALTGNANIRLASTFSASDTAGIIGPTSGMLTIGPSVTIGGAGRLTNRIALAGLLTSDDPLEAPLDIRGIVTRSGSGRIEIADANTLLTDGSITNVPISSVGNGELRLSAASSSTAQLVNLSNDARTVVVSGAAVFANTTFTRALDIRPGATARVSGSPFNAGPSVLVNSFGANTNTFLQFDQSTTINGAGTILLSAGVLSIDTAQITTSNAAYQIVAGTSRTLAGSGKVGGLVTWNGVISPSNPVEAVPVGQIDFSNSLKLNRSSTFRVDVTDEFAFDHIGGAGEKKLEGTLVASLPTGYYPSPDTAFPVVGGAGALSGTFFSIVPPAGFKATVEYAANTASVRFQKTCPADMNGDGLVDDSDFQYFVVAYNVAECSDPSMPVAPADQSSGQCFADINRDGLVMDEDFVLFASAYDALVCP